MEEETLSASPFLHVLAGAILELSNLSMLVI